MDTKTGLISTPFTRVLREEKGPLGLLPRKAAKVVVIETLKYKFQVRKMPKNNFLGHLAGNQE